MTIPSEIERLDTGDLDGCKYRGGHREVLTPDQTNLIPYILSADESGALCINGSAEGGAWTLPPAEAGLWYEFLTTLSVTSVEVNSVTCASGDFMIGVAVGGNLTIGASGDVFTADGATDVTLTSNGSTTGGLIGDSFVLTAINSSQWVVTQGVNIGSGTNATPFA
jgi:hypothetical protein